jgi:thymidylate synthase (FAD)
MSIDVLDKGYVRLVDFMGSDLSIVNAARVSYDKESLSFDDKDERLLNFLLKEGHVSPLRHATLTYEVYAPLFVARQWWKYAVGSSHVDDQVGWNESSRRYITEHEEFYVPDKWRLKPENSKQGSGDDMSVIDSVKWTSGLVRNYERCARVYYEALDAGIAPEQARLFLPAYGMYVRWRWTASLAAVIHFLQQRLEHYAQFEIQEYASAVRKLTSPLFPVVFEKAGL